MRPVFCILLILFCHYCQSIDPECKEIDTETDLPHWCHEELAVELGSCTDKLAEHLAERYGFQNLGQIGSLECHYLFRHKHQHNRVRRSAHESLNRHPYVKWSEGQRPKTRTKRDFQEETGGFRTQLHLPWKDPLYRDQWYLVSGASGGWDMRVREAWKLGYSGKNVSVSILDDGVQWQHPDLKQNYISLELFETHLRMLVAVFRHGTRCAGEVASVAGNAWCGVGVAYNAGIGGVRMLDGAVTDRVEASSLSHNQYHVDIYSASWGPEDDGRTVDGPGLLARKAFYKGITEGRGGKGNIFIWASGNGGGYQDSCSCDGYTTSIYTLSVSSASMNNRKPWYLEQCPSTIATTYSSGSYNEHAIVTADMPNSCTNAHTGTSASAPLAAGMVALALEANPNLNWRDMQHVVLRSANPIPLEATDGWTTNGVNRRVSHKFGYGLMDAERLVKLAQTWKTVPKQHICAFKYDFDGTNKELMGPFKRSFEMTIGECRKCRPVRYLEHVHASITIRYPQRGHLNISLISPSGTRSVLLPQRHNDNSRSGFRNWPFLTVHTWGEDPRGTWTLVLENASPEVNNLDHAKSGIINQWDLTFYGTETPAQDGDTLYPLTTSYRTSKSITCGPVKLPDSWSGGEKKQSILIRPKPGYEHIQRTKNLNTHFTFVWGFAIGVAFLLFVIVIAFLIMKLRKKRKVPQSSSVLPMCNSENGPSTLENGTTVSHVNNVYNEDMDRVDFDA